MRSPDFHAFDPYSFVGNSKGGSPGPQPDPIALLFQKYSAYATAWYDVSDMSTMFQDAEGTIPVTAVGQRVMLHKDKSGGGNHRQAPSVAKAPILRDGYIEAETASRLSTTTDGPSTPKLPSSDFTMVAGILPTKTAPGAGIFLNAPQLTGADGGFSLNDPAYTDGGLGVSIDKSAGYGTIYAGGKNTTPTSIALTIQETPSLVKLYAGTASNDTNQDFGTGNFWKRKLHFYNDSGDITPFEGRDYGVAIIGAKLLPEELQLLRDWAISQLS